MPPPAISPDQILDYAPKQKARIVSVDANVVAYFGDMFAGLRKGLSRKPPPETRLTEALAKPDHTNQSHTAGAHSRS